MSTDISEGIFEKLMSIRGDPPGTSAGLTSVELRWLCETVTPILMAQPVLLDLKPPLMVCGDTHAQYPDVIRIFEKGGYPPTVCYLFLGDYVDRGYQGIEVIALFFWYKIKYPTLFYMLRGNHECSYINRLYGFYDECIRYHSIQIWKDFSEVFKCLPIAAIIDDKIFCVHGGLSPDLHSMDDIKSLCRPLEVPEQGLLCDLLWADPDGEIEGWGANDRGTSYTFGCDIATQFCHDFGFELICRAHQAVMGGFEFPYAQQNLITLFSAPNYCYEFTNKGAILKIDEHLFCAFVILEPHDWSMEMADRPATPPRGQSYGEQVQAWSVGSA
jgi:serine/threonine-protein phosphatase PP1 catalytic subunit